MRIIIIMLVFEPNDHTALKSVIISDYSLEYPGTTMIARLCDSCYFQSLFSRRFPGVPYPTPSTDNCYNEQQNNRFNPCWFHPLFRESMPDTIIPNTIA